jgi:hypothetical protein
MTTERQIRDKIKSFKPTSQKADLFDPNLNDKSTRFFKFKNGHGRRYRLWLFTDRVKLETPLATSLLFSVNIPDNVCLANKLLQEKSDIGRIFTDAAKDKQVTECVDLLVEDLKILNLKADEGINVYGNWLQLTLSNERALLPEIELCDRIKAKIELNFPDKDEKIDYSDLPTELLEVVQKFGHLVSTDDFERQEKSKTLTSKQRKTFLEVMEPKLEGINNFLDGFKDIPLSDGAIGLQNLAELFTELSIETEMKNHS